MKYDYSTYHTSVLSYFNDTWTLYERSDLNQDVSIGRVLA